MSTLDSVKEKTEKAVSFVEWFAEVLRGKKWVTKLLLLDVLLLVFLNPITLLTLLKVFLTDPQLPARYSPVFWLVVGLVFLAALIVAYRTLPRKAEAAGGVAEHKAIKGLRPFGFEDAEVFARLQREATLRECLATVTDRDFRFGVLYGESGCGKSSFLQAGLWPRLLKQNLSCVYVKITELDPLDSVRHALAEKFQRPSEQSAGADLPALLATVVPVGSTPLVLLFDQFEQFFVHHQRKEDREPFARALADWYKSRQAPSVKILICLREDFYGRLIELQKAMGYSLGPQQSLRLEKFTPKEAAAIFRVIAETEDLPCDEDFVQELSERELASREDGLISAMDLQILAWMIRGQRSSEERAFNRTAFQKLGGLEGLLERFLSRALKVRETEARRQAALMTLLALTNLERNVRAGVLSAEEVEAKLLGGTVAPEGVREALEWLARGDVRLATPIEREDGRGYELAHERLIPALRRLAGKELSAADQANQLLDRRVNEWLGNNRARRYLLTRRELRLIRKQNPYLIWGPHKAQKEALLAKSRRRLRVRVGLVSLPVLVLTLVTAFSVRWLFSPSFPLWFLPWSIAVSAREVLLFPGPNGVDLPTKIARALSMTDVERALSIGNGFKDGPAKSAFLTAIGTTRAWLGDEPQASAILEQAHKVAERIGNPSEKASALASIAFGLAEIGYVTCASTINEQALKVTEETRDSPGKAWALASIALVMAEVGDKTSTTAVFEHAVKVAEGLKDPEEEAIALAGILSVLGERADNTKASTLLEESSVPIFERAFRAMEGIHDPKKRAQVLAEIVDDHGLVRALKKQHSKLFGLALQLIEAISDAKNKSHAFHAVAIFFGRIGEKTKAVAFLDRARQLGEGIGAYLDRSAFEVESVVAMAWVGAETEDKGILERARQIAESIDDPRARSSALSQLLRAKHRFEGLRNRRELSRFVRPVGEAFLNGDLQDAFGMLENSNFSSKREDGRDYHDFDPVMIAFFADVLEAMVKAQNPSLAKGKLRAVGVRCVFPVNAARYSTQTAGTPTIDPYGDPHPERISADTVKCRQLALQASGDTGSQAVQGTVVGGAAPGSAIGAAVGNPGTGAAVGAATAGVGGGVGKGYDTEGDYKRAYGNCMRNRGHNVIN